jgi:hypothetical protein
MLYFPNGRDYISQEFPVAQSATIAAEGIALVADTTAGVFGVKPSAGVSGEKFVGVAVSQQISITAVARVESHIVPATNVVTLNRTPSSGTLSVFNKTTGAVVPASGGSNWSLAGRQLTLPAGMAGNEIETYFKYQVTLNESRSLQGDTFPGGAAGFLVGQCGAVRNGTIYTSEFDTTVNWNATNPSVTLGANGQFTIGGSGAAVPAVVVAVPSASQPFLGLMLTN